MNCFEFWRVVIGNETTVNSQQLTTAVFHRIRVGQMGSVGMITSHYKHILVGVILIFLVACNSVNRDQTISEKLANHMMQSKVCSTACWRGIQPSITTEQEFLSIVQDNSSIYDNLSRWDSSNGERSYDWFDQELGLSFRATFRGGLVIFIQIFTQDKITYNEFLNKINNPNSYQAILSAGDGDQSFGIRLFYEDQGIILSTFIYPIEEDDFNFESCLINIHESLKIDNIFIVYPEPAEEMADLIDMPIFGNLNEWSDEGLINQTNCGQD